MEIVKGCAHCGRARPVSEFYYLAKQEKYSRLCKECERAKSREYHARHKNRENRRNKQYYDENREARLERMKAFYRRQRLERKKEKMETQEAQELHFNQWLEKWGYSWVEYMYQDVAAILDRATARELVITLYGGGHIRHKEDDLA